MSDSKISKIIIFESKLEKIRTELIELEISFQEIFSDELEENLERVRSEK